MVLIATSSLALFIMCWEHVSGAAIIGVGVVWLWAQWGGSPDLWKWIDHRYLNPRRERKEQRRKEKWLADGGERRAAEHHNTTWTYSGLIGKRP